MYIMYLCRRARFRADGMYEEMKKKSLGFKLSRLYPLVHTSEKGMAVLLLLVGFRHKLN